MYEFAECLVVSLWQVDDTGTSLFMQEFYNLLLQQGKSPSEALCCTVEDVATRTQGAILIIGQRLRFWANGGKLY